jgi:hypothetical protein
MKKLMFLVSILMVVSFSLFAKDEHGHDHSNIKPTKGGKIVELSDEAGFIEVVHDASKGEITIYLLDGEGKPLKIKEAPKLNLFVKEGEAKKKKQIATTFKDAELKESDVFISTDEVLKSKELEGRLAIKIGEKSIQANLATVAEKKKNEHGHDH